MVPSSLYRLAVADRVEQNTDTVWLLALVHLADHAQRLRVLLRRACHGESDASQDYVMHHDRVKSWRAVRPAS